MSAEPSLLLKQAESLLSNETDFIANAANLAALVFNNVTRLNWVGFYFLQGDELVLGPFSGQVACTRIALGSGVCGTAFANQETLVVEDVHQFEGHIACDVASRSEVVVPFESDRLSGVLDIDSPDKNRFTEHDKLFYQQITAIYLNACD
jgi:GAF domain-containing protein